MRWRNFLLFSHILVSAGAALSVWVSTGLFSALVSNHHGFCGTMEYKDRFNDRLILCSFFFFSTLCLYHFHEWFLTENARKTVRGQWIVRNRHWILTIILISALGSLCSFYFLSEKHQWLSVPIILLSILYTAPKIPLKPFMRLRTLVRYKTLYLSLVWTYSTTLMPVDSLSVPVTLYAISRFITFYVVCFLFDYRDRVHDQDAGLPSYIHSLSVGKSRKILLSLLSVNVMMTLLLGLFLPYTIVIAHLLPLPVIFYFRNTFLTKNEDLYFYGYLDALVFIGPLCSLFFL